MFKRIVIFVLVLVSLLFLYWEVLAAPPFIIQRTFIPETSSTYDIGTSTQQWRNGYFVGLCLDTDCRTAWPSSGGATTTVNLQVGPDFTLQGTAGQITVQTVGATTTWSLANLNVSQFTNDSAYITAPVPYASTTGVQALLSFPLPYASTTHISFPIPYASTTGIQADLGGLYVSSFNSGTGAITYNPFPIPYASTTGIQAGLSFPLPYASTTHISFPVPFASTTGVQATITFPIPIASTSLSANTPLSISGNILSIATATASIGGYLQAGDFAIFLGKQSLITTTTCAIGEHLFSVSSTGAFYCSADSGGPGGGISSLNGSTSSTQTFSAGTGMAISTANGVHTFTNIGLQSLGVGSFLNLTSATGTPTLSLTITPVSSTRAINVGSFLTGGGDLSADRTISLTITPVSSTRAINVGSFLTGGGDLSADRTISLTITPVSSTRSISAGLGLTGGGDLSADRTITLNMAGVTCTGTDKVSSISATGTAICTADQTGAGGTPKINPVDYQIVSGPVVWTNMALAESEFGGANASSSLYRTPIDLTSSTQFRLYKSGQIVACSAGTSRLWARYSSTTVGGLPISPWVTLDGAATTTSALSCGTTGTSSTAWMTAQAAIKFDGWLKIEGGGGNGVADPNFGEIGLQVR